MARNLLPAAGHASIASPEHISPHPIDDLRWGDESIRTSVSAGWAEGTGPEIGTPSFSPN